MTLYLVTEGCNSQVREVSFRGLIEYSFFLEAAVCVCTSWLLHAKAIG